jgi:peptidoglycan hydrolase-like protein with peptidoglycan-binding domain
MQRGTRFTTALAGTLLLVTVGTGAAFGGFTLVDLGTGAQRATAAAGPALREPASPVAVEPVPAAQEVAPAQEIAPTTIMEPAPEPEPRLERGDRGRPVRNLQHRLSQLAWYVPPMSGAFDTATVTAVRGFQAKRGLEVTGEVDVRTWRRLVQMTRRPTADEMFDRAGPALFAPGDVGPEVREIQARLRQIGWFFGDVSDSYAEQATAAVRGFQAKRMIPVTGEVDRRTLDLLVGMTREPTADELANRAPDPADGAPLDPRCTTGRVLCIDKSSNSLRWVVDGTVLTTVDVRFGSDELPTREGQFAVTWKSRDHVSSLYNTSMPFAMFFSGGQAVHYSPDFAANGYNGASHGCVNVRDYGTVAALFDQVDIGDKVVVYWS